MDIPDIRESNRHTFLNHVFNTSEESKAEILNVLQYAIMAIVPIVILNKVIQRFIPEANSDKSTLELLLEILMQIIFMFGGIILIHRIISFVPTYSGFKYDSLILTNVILGFLIIVLSIQTKMGIKVNILTERLGDLWDGTTSSSNENVKTKPGVRVSHPLSGHVSSQADYVNNPHTQGDMFPPAPSVSSKAYANTGYDNMMGQNNMMDMAGPLPANSLVGNKF